VVLLLNKYARKREYHAKCHGAAVSEQLLARLERLSRTGQRQNRGYVSGGVSEETSVAVRKK